MPRAFWSSPDQTQALTCQSAHISLTFSFALNSKLLGSRGDKSLSLLLEGKHAFISGGTRGIGAALCEVFAREGADVAFNYQSSDDLAENVKSTIESFGRQA